jgi:branched-chain amino acid aminotransferase
MKVYIDGRFYDKDDAKISVFDHGLLYGDGVFEGIRAYSGRIFKLEEHVDRLYASAKAILMNIPMTPSEMATAVLDTCRENQIRDGYIRLVVTRGPGGLGLSPYSCAKPSVIIIAGKIQLYPAELYEKGMAIITAATTRNMQNAVNPAIKSLNYLNNVMAKIEALHAGYEEALMLNSSGFIAECTGDNVFIITGNQVLTPPVTAGALRGITRNVAMELAAELGLTVIERDLTRYDVYTADECFLTGTGAEVIPVVEVDARKIGTGVPGPHTTAIIQRYKEVVNSSGPEIPA